MNKLLTYGLAGSTLALGLMMNGCATVDDGDKTMKGAGIGAVAGAVIGGVAANAQGHDWRKGAAIGGAGGAILGGTVGVVMDKQENDLRKAGIRTERDEAGNLVINLSGETLKFDSGKNTLKPEGEALLAKLGGVLSQYPENRISIEGHTDNVGKASDNLALSQSRADAVKASLLTKQVQPRSILSVTGYGSGNPVGDNKTAEGKAANRRVELKISLDQAEAEANQKEREKYKKK